MTSATSWQAGPATPPVLPPGLLGAPAIPVQSANGASAATITFVDADNVRRSMLLTEATAAEVAVGFPVRVPKPHRGARNRLGFYWSAALLPARMGDFGRPHLVQLESRLEGRFALCADFDPDVVVCVPQPFTIHADGRPADGHTPDFLTVRTDGSVVVFDIRPAEHIDDATNRQYVDTTTLLASAGWQHCVWHDVNAHHYELLDWIGRTRVPGSVHEWVVDLARDRFTVDCYGTLTEKVARAGAPIPFIRPAIDALLWRHELLIDWEQPLDEDTILHRGPGSVPRDMRRLPSLRASTSLTWEWQA